MGKLDEGQEKVWMVREGNILEETELGFPTDDIAEQELGERNNCVEVSMEYAILQRCDQVDMLQE